jgi:tryptophan synthase alpha chain
MADNRIIARLEQCRRENRGALMPYFTAGFPDLETSAALIRSADALGVDIVEIGFPYSDSIADGPVIQSSFYHVLERGHRVTDSFDLVRRVRADVRCGIAAMASYSIVGRFGAARFMDEAAAAGFDGVIVPDVPVEESAPLRREAERAGLCHIGLVAPTSPRARREAIARDSTGFVYQIAVAGTTGERSELPASLAAEVAQLRAACGLPVCVGFGVATADHVRAICRFADGAIVGSAVIRRIDAAAASGASREAIVAEVTAFLADLLAGTARAL